MFTRRMLAVAGAAAIGTLGALTIPSAASAHHTTIQSKVSCVGDQAVITWFVYNSQTNIEGEITKLEPSQGQVVKSTATDDKTPPGLLYGANTVLKVGAMLPLATEKKPTDIAKAGVGQVSVPAGLGTATLTVDTKWDYSKSTNKRTRTDDVKYWTETGTARWSKEQCGDSTPGTPTVAFESNCDGTVTVVIDNPASSKNTEFKVQSQVTSWKTNVTVPAGKKSEPISVPKADAGDIKVSIKNDDNGKALGKYKFAAPESCEDADYTGSFEPSCDGVKVTLNNPADGDTLKVTILANGKEQYKFEVAPGKTESKLIGRQDSLKIVVKVEGFEPDGEFEYTVPAGCGASLPVTGANATLMAGGASVLLLGGAALFMVARRRRVQFTA